MSSSGTFTLAALYGDMARARRLLSTLDPSDAAYRNDAQLLIGFRAGATPSVITERYVARLARAGALVTELERLVEHLSIPTTRSLL